MNILRVCPFFFFFFREVSVTFSQGPNLCDTCDWIIGVGEEVSQYPPVLLLTLMGDCSDEERARNDNYYCINHSNTIACTMYVHYN